MPTNTEQPTSYLLPPAAYTSEEWFRLERERLFEQVWVFAGVEHNLAEPGDFITVQVGRAPIVIVRDTAGELRAFHNLCRHRGLPLVEGVGNCGRSMVCPYHRWNFGLDGTLRVIPQRDQFPADLDFEQLGLKPVRCEVWKTLVFVHLDLHAEPLTEWLGDFGSLFDNFHPERLVEISTQEHHVAANWKLYVENHVDWLHLWYLHAETLSSYDHSAGERLECGPHWASYEPLVSEQRGSSPRVAGEADSEADSSDRRSLVPIEGLTGRDATNGAHLIFPSLTLFTSAGYWMLGRVIPNDATHFTLYLRAFGEVGGDAAGFTTSLNQVMNEDYSAAEAIQRALESPAFGVGPLATAYEREIMRFQQHYLGYVSTER